MQASGCDGRGFVVARDGRFRGASSPSIHLHLALLHSCFSPAHQAASCLRTEVELARQCRRARHRIRPRSIRLVFAAKSHYLSRASICGGTRIMARRAMPHARCQRTVVSPWDRRTSTRFLTTTAARSSREFRVCCAFFVCDLAAGCRGSLHGSGAKGSRAGNTNGGGPLAAPVVAVGPRTSSSVSVRTTWGSRP